jgi:hypothetical protein
LSSSLFLVCPATGPELTSTLRAACIQPSRCNPSVCERPAPCARTHARTHAPDRVPAPNPRGKLLVSGFHHGPEPGPWGRRI